MSDLINQITALERKVREAEEARRTADRIWGAAEDTLEEIRAVEASLLDLHGEIDGFVADNNYPAVQQAAHQIEGETSAQRLLPLVRRAMLLLALHDGSPLPAPDAMEMAPELAPSEAGHPVLTLAELMRESTRELEAYETKLRSIWHDEEDDGALQNALSEARSEAVADRATRAGRQLMTLCDYIAEDLCPTLNTSVEQLDVDGSLRALAALDLAGKEAPKAYKVYEVALSEQYERNPCSLGEMGEQLMTFEAWIHTQS
ncbi:hypothetical protein [Streptomyces rimosus]|uniref:hypothetical protein n=1 Tax=Streptomyces rimosus TaxID=1927 RepID=UPI0037908353